MVTIGPRKWTSNLGKEEGDSEACMAGTTGSPDTMDVVLDCHRHVKVDDLFIQGSLCAGEPMKQVSVWA